MVHIARFFVVIIASILIIQPLQPVFAQEVPVESPSEVPKQETSPENTVVPEESSEPSLPATPEADVTVPATDSETVTSPEEVTPQVPVSEESSTEVTTPITPVLPELPLGQVVEEVPLQVTPSSTGSIEESVSSDALLTLVRNAFLPKSRPDSERSPEQQLIVKYKENNISLSTFSGRSLAFTSAQTANVQPVDVLQESNMALVEVPEGQSVEVAIARLSRDPGVAYVQPNFTYTARGIDTNDTNRDQLWGLDNQGQKIINGFYDINNPGAIDSDLDIPEAWMITDATVHTPVTVAVIDTGVDYNHPDLANNMWDGTNCRDENGNFLGGCMHGYDFEDDDKNPLPYHPHGTHVAGTIAATGNNGMGIVGVAPKAKIMALKTSFTSFEIIRAVQFAEQNGASIINASFGGYHYDQALYDTIAAYPGLVIAAADNASHNEDLDPSYPVSFDLPNIISVAATDQRDNLANFSSYGAANVDVGAPGVNVLSTISYQDILVTEILFDNFDDLTTPELPEGWVADEETTVWESYELEDPIWGVVIYPDLNVPYTENVDTTLTSDVYDIRTTGTASLDFYTRCDTPYNTTEFTDYMQLELSGNGTDFTVATDVFGDEIVWDEATLDEQNWDELDDTGEAEGYFSVVIPDEYTTENFQFRFRWVTDEHDNDYLGCAIDEVSLDIIEEQGVEYTYEFADGTSMATANVSGVAALLKGYNPNLTTAQIKNIILTTGDSVPSLSGITATGKRVNAFNALQAANPAKALTSFTIPSQVGVTTIDEALHTVKLTVPFGTDVTALIPTLAITGASVSPTSGTAQNFSTPVVYTVTAADGSTQTYTVTVTIADQIVVPPPPDEETDGNTDGNIEEPENTSKSGSRSGTRVHKKLAPADLQVILGGNTTGTQGNFIHYLGFGSRGESVVELQKILITKGYLHIDAPTGYFGPLTEAALKAYQQENGVEMTGGTDTQTRTLLNKEALLSMIMQLQKMTISTQ